MLAAERHVGGPAEGPQNATPSSGTPLGNMDCVVRNDSMHCMYRDPIPSVQLCYKCMWEQQHVMLIGCNNAIRKDHSTLLLYGIHVHSDPAMHDLI